MDKIICKEIEALIVVSDELVERASVSGSRLGHECIQGLANLQGQDREGGTPVRAPANRCMEER